jgi:hypothetical protein
MVLWCYGIELLISMTEPESESESEPKPYE